MNKILVKPMNDWPLIYADAADFPLVNRREPVQSVLISVPFSDFGEAKTTIETQVVTTLMSKKN